MDDFDCKVLSYKRVGSLGEHWFDGDKDLGPEITTELLIPYGQDAWEVTVAMQTIGGVTHKLSLKRHCPLK